MTEYFKYLKNLGEIVKKSFNNEDCINKLTKITSELFLSNILIINKNGSIIKQTNLPFFESLFYLIFLKAKFIFIKSN